ncbi:AAA family ATPase, partial [Clostridium botulinum]|nr:AAA family ATPase [Clostridium botulinum]
MNLYLNTDKPLKNYNELFNEEYFVDKSLIIKLLNKKINTKSKYVCVTRPRRFGKSSVADMLGAYYSKAVDSKNIFDKLKISKAYGYEENLNKYNVISISFNRLSDIGNTYDDYINRIKINLKEDIKEMYSHIDADKYLSISDLLESLSDKFIFIFDEWDYIFNNNL